MLKNLLFFFLAHMPEWFVWLFSKRYIAGKELSDAVDIIQKLNGSSIHATIDVLGENSKIISEIDNYFEIYKTVLNTVHKYSLSATLSFKPSMFGLLIDKEICCSKIKELLTVAKKFNISLCMDMEDSALTDDEIDVFERLYKEFPSNLSFVIQAYLKRSIHDLNRLNQLQKFKHPINIRICKGIYNEPESIAFKTKREINQNYLLCLRYMLKNNFYCSIATHDKSIINNALSMLRESKYPDKMYEFQMLYGVKTRLRDLLVRKGLKVRVYVPFGTHWLKYSLRRLKENPGMLWSMIKALIVRR